MSNTELPLIQTKFCGPRVTADIVARDRLLTLMDSSLECPLTMVSAPAGYGKSMLVSQWLQRQKHPTVWLSLDQADSDLQQFLAYLIAAIHNEFPDTCNATKQLISAPDCPPIPVIVSHLLNDLIAITEQCSIALDDYHQLDQSSLVHEFIEQSLEHPLPNIHLIMITRRDPSLPLTRLRALNLMLEIRMQDLQFTRSEISELFCSNLDYSIKDASVAHLQGVLEGWAVGLRLVLLSLRNSKNPNESLLSLRGGIPQMQEYLVNEVLSVLSDDMRECILKSSILNRFCDELIEFICATERPAEGHEQISGHDFTHELQTRNLFTINLDPQNQWFRYHHLFQALLQNELGKILPAEDIASVHMRACIWSETHDFIEEAIFHALKAGDAVFAARIIERHCYSELEKDRWMVVGRWLAMIPEEISGQRITIMITKALISSAHQRFDHMILFTDQAQALLADGKGSHGQEGEVDLLKGMANFWGEAFEEAIRCLESAKSKVESHKSLLIAETDLHLALSRYMNGQGDLAIQELNDRIRDFGGIQLARRVGALSFIHMLSGDLHNVRTEAWRMRNMDAQMRTPLVDAWSYYFDACANLINMRLDLALENFQSVLSRSHVTDRRAVIDAYVGMALTQQLSGKPENANTTLENLAAFVNETDDPLNQVLMKSCQARIELLRGNREAAIRWADSYNESPGVFDLFVWLESPARTRVRIYISIGSPASLEKAQQGVDEIRTVSESCQLINQLIEVSVLESLILDKQGNSDQAMLVLENTIALAEPSDWIRPFIEAGPEMNDLLKRYCRLNQDCEFACHLLELFQSFNKQNPHNPVTETTSPEVPGGLFAEELTNREIDILELLALRMQNKEIANKLFISVHTVKDHLKHIYQKLGTVNRREAVTVAIERKIISAP